MPMTHLPKKDLISILDLNKDEIESILNVSDMIRHKHKKPGDVFPAFGQVAWHDIYQVIHPYKGIF
jgi:ornithine carbamoyltransferase